uniref:Helicase C-terminal domain-containing protein n=1 Tax=Populus alba TaxID=43335 RepID=A0A4U5NJU1_POPAL|nr:hypothetical protein D5086_0000263600 [Populus alba]
MTPRKHACCPTRAGGQGLNLTGADNVIAPDLDFNPQIDRQVEDHCHSIGHTKPVTMYRMVTKGTVDETVNEMAKWKLVLDAAVLDSVVGVDKSSRTTGEILSSLTMVAFCSYPPAFNPDPMDRVLITDQQATLKAGIGFTSFSSPLEIT